MPVLHDRVSLSRALLQLVGSGVACGNGEEPESGSCGADARRGGEVQYVPCAAAFCHGEGRYHWKAGDRSCRLRSSLRGSLPDGGDPVWESGRPERSCLSRSTFPGRIPVAGTPGHRAEGLLQVQGGMGESAGRVQVRSWFGGETWLAPPWQTVAGSPEAKNEPRFHSSCSGLPPG